MNELLELSVCDLAERLQSRKASPVELMEAVLARIDETNEDLNAFVALHDREALLALAKASEERIGKGEARKLEGIPLGVKDLENTVGLPNTRGSLIFKDRVSDFDDTQIARLKGEGAIVVGKTNAPEFGYTAITKNLVYGVTRNPWNLAHTPGGSSGGSSAALAGCVCPMNTASDGGGSIRIPASFVGAYGLKVSFGRVPRGPLRYWASDDTSVYGPLTKTVRDAALQLDITAGVSPTDPNTLPDPGYSYVDKLAEGLPPGLRIGFSPDLGYGVVQADIAAAVEEAAGVFEKLGHTLVPLRSGPPVMGREWGLLGGWEKAAELHEYLPDREAEFGRTFIAGVKMASERMTPEIWKRISDGRIALQNWCAEVFDEFDLLITPTVPYDAPPAKGPFPEETEGRRQPPAGVAAFTIPFNLSWHPAATMRVGLSGAGLPIGMQIVGPRHRDDLVLQASHAFEQERPWHPEWPKSWESPAAL
ncbi:MAG: amidase [Myxococcota bacterium]|nr:amidase [Myxococcota bacterium]